VPATAADHGSREYRDDDDQHTQRRGIRQTGSQQGHRIQTDDVGRRRTKGTEQDTRRGRRLVVLRRSVSSFGTDHISQQRRRVFGRRNRLERVRHTSTNTRVCEIYFIIDLRFTAKIHAVPFLNLPSSFDLFSSIFFTTFTLYFFWIYTYISEMNVKQVNFKNVLFAELVSRFVSRIKKVPEMFEKKNHKNTTTFSQVETLTIDFSFSSMDGLSTFSSAISFTSIGLDTTSPFSFLAIRL